MPAKGKKVAARQSQINKRKKRQPRKLAVGQTAVAEAPIATAEVAETTTPRASRAPRASRKVRFLLPLYIFASIPSIPS